MQSTSDGITRSGAKKMIRMLRTKQFRLSQIIEGKERIIEYGAIGVRGLRPAERNYSASEKKILGLVEGVYHFYHYLGAEKCLMRSDNEAVKYFNTTIHVTGRLS